MRFLLRSDVIRCCSQLVPLNHISKCSNFFSICHSFLLARCPLLVLVRIHIYVQNNFNLAIHSFICTVLTSLCVETLLSSLDMKMRILWCTQLCVYVKESLFLFMTEFRVQTQGVPPSWKWLHQEWDQAWERGSEGQSKKGKRGGNQIHKRSWLFFRISFSPPFSAPPFLSHFPVLQCASLFGRGKRSGLDRARNFFTCLLLHSAQSSGKRARGMTWPWMREYLGIFYGAAG